MGLFDKMVTKKASPTEMKKQRRERHGKEISAYRYVRTTIDRGAQQYSLTGQTDELAKIMDPPDDR